MPKLTKEQFIERSRAVHGDKYDYSKVEYVDIKTKVCIICPEHGEFWQRPSNHMSGRGCPSCGFEKVVSGLRIYTKEKCEEISRQYSSPSSFNKGNQAAYNVALRNGWLKEFTWLKYKIKQTKKKSPTIYTQESMLQKLKVTFGDLYDYSLVEYHAMKMPITLICHKTDENGKEHGPFSMRPDNLFSGGQGCPQCSFVRRVASQTKTLEEFIQQARKVHGDKYEYHKVNYINTNTKVTIICPSHGVFMQTPSNHLKGKGCPYCTGNAKKWNKDTCEEEARRYEYIVNFSQQCSRAYNLARENGWLKDYTWLKKLPPKDEDYNKQTKYIYAYEFTAAKAVYVGLTNSVIKRDWQHRHGKGGSSVYKYSQASQIEIPKPIIKESGIFAAESGARENFWVEYYKKEGWLILNKAKTGERESSLGTNSPLKWNKQTIAEKAKECNYDLALFAEKYIGAYNAIGARYPYLRDKLFPTRSIHHHHSVEEAILVATSEKYKNRTALRRKHLWAYKVLFDAGKLDDIFGKPHEYTKEEALEEAKKYRSIDRIRLENHPLWTYLKNNNLFKEAKPTDPMFHRCKTIEEAWELSLHYRNIADLSNHAKLAYHMLRDAGLLQKRYPDSRKFKKKDS